MVEVAITVADAVVTEAAAAAAEGAGGATMMAEAEDTAEGRGKRYLILGYTISSTLLYYKVFSTPATTTYARAGERGHVAAHEEDAGRGLVSSAGNLAIHS